MPPAPHTRLGLSITIVYGIGQIAHGVKSIIFGIFSLYFYITVQGLAGKLVGLAMAVGLIWDALIDPLIGSLSDRAEGRLGKRHGFMLFGAAGMGLAFWAFFSPPQGLSRGLLFTWLLITNIVVRTMTSLFSVPYFALGAELSQDYHERTSITGIRGALSLGGTLLTTVLVFVLFFPPTASGADPKLNPDGYWSLGLFAGLIMTGVGLISSVGTLPYRRPAVGRRQAPPGGHTSLGSETWDALRNAAFRRVFLSYSTFFFGTVINATLMIHFLTYFVRITESQFLSVFQLLFYVGAIAGVFWWLWISRKLDKHLVYFAGTLSTAVIMGMAYFFIGEGRPFGTGSSHVLLVGHGLAGFFGSVLWIMPTSMIADVADQDELVGGQRREGVFFGLFNFGEQIAAGAALLVAGVLIDEFAGLRPGEVAQSAETIERIGMLYSLLPAAPLIGAALLMLRYPLNQSTVQAIQRQLAAKASH